MSTATRKKRQLLTPEQKRFIEENYRKLGPAECARQAGTTYAGCSVYASRMGVGLYKRFASPTKQYNPIADADRLLNTKPSDGVVIWPRATHEMRERARWSETLAENLQPAGFEKRQDSRLYWVTWIPAATAVFMLGMLLQAWLAS